MNRRHPRTADGLPLSNTLHGRVPDPVEYLRTRRRPAGTSLSTILPRYAHGRDLPAELPGHPTVQALIDAFADNLDLRNDLYSHRQESEVERDGNTPDAHRALPACADDGLAGG
ncbi:terpene synthase family protein [Kitasatospora sp. NBC_01246]|uniref:terpene synthase family protein n=1 Tax=Kitasatospora sp. NBC_01246 TaxID=2903570 RepID=UPI002E368EBB|nr:terpene synthase family protein [Kitasatospora sp. NBC_01246]